MQTLTFYYITLSTICLGLILFGLNFGIQKTTFSKSRKNTLFFRTIAILIIWLIGISVLGAKDILSDFSTLPPKITMILMPPIIIWLIITIRSKTLKSILDQIPPHWIIYFQSFRIIVELILWKQLLMGVTPIQMTFEGRNFDILAGLTAPIVAYLYSKNKDRYRRLALIWNFAGMALLTNVLVIAILSFPTKFRYFMNEPSNTFVSEFPGILLPGFLVMVAYTMHYFSIKQLLSKNHS